MGYFPKGKKAEMKSVLVQHQWWTPTKTFQEKEHQRRLQEPLKAHMVVENQVILGCPRAGILQNWSSWQMLAQLTF